MEKGKKFELTYFDDKDKAQGRTEYEIIDKEESGNAVTATVHMIHYDKKDKMVMESDYKVQCEDGVFKIDIRGVLNAAQMQQMSSMDNMDVTVETEDLEIPSTLSVGDNLNDGSLNMKMNASGSGMTLMSFRTDISNRKVVNKEDVTTPAGTFDCYVISSDVHSKAGFVNMNFETKEWISEGVGVVRSESYRKGKLDGYSLLTKF